MSSVNKIEIEKFSNMADEWWDPHGKFKPLHKFNPIRIKYIKENIIRQFKIKNKNKPLSGINILDIGCGGGLLSEPMCRLGADVTGIDASIKNIKISKLHAKKDNLKINYICSSPEKLKKRKFLTCHCCNSLKVEKTLMAPVIPMSVIAASPGPFTTHPIIDKVIGVFM